MTQRVELVAIDYQWDFCTPTKKGGKLYVPGAEDDVERVAAMIKRIGKKLYDIHVTLDSHHLMHVAHPLYWKDSKGKHPDPFTIISAKDVKNGVWTPTVTGLTRRSEEYVESLERNKRYALCIWNPHCLIGSPGHSIQEPLLTELLKWESDNRAVVDKITKGSNIYTEHYSAVKADVEQPDDPTTQLNTRLIQTLEEADVVAFTGEAATHCVLNTMRDIFDNFADKDTIKKCVLLTDSTSCIPGFEQAYKDFVKEYTAKGMTTSTTKEFLS